LAFLVLLIVATAILFAWLLVSVTRFALGDVRLPGLRPSPGRPADTNAEAPAILAAPERVTPEPPVDPGLEAEIAIREHLYGRHPRRA
jgi:hypothetical protein